MKLVIFEGCFGTRINEESFFKPKLMIQIEEMPILWHIIKYYSFYGIHDFIIYCVYKGYVIKEYFSNYFLHMLDVIFDMKNNEMVFLNKIKVY
jgi:glucose-1-phosphate cytidylyltransferase